MRAVLAPVDVVSTRRPSMFDSRPLVRSLAPVAIAALLLAGLPGHELRAAPQAQDVNVVNTPTVAVAGTTPGKVTNPVQIDASVPVSGRCPDTAVSFDEQVSNLSDPIDVSAARTLRIVATTGNPLGCPVQAYIQYGASPFESVRLGSQLTPTPIVPVTETYDLPGVTL